MALDPYVAAVLRRLQAEFVAANTSRSRVIGPAAKALGVLPITDDWARDFGIRIADGEVIAFNRDPPHDPRVEPFSKRRLTILNEARWKHPELQGLIPPRPADAVDCTFCDARGERPKCDGTPRACSHCVAGWVPADLANEARR